MSPLTLLFVLALNILSTTAHFQINTPQWRDNSFNSPYSQYSYPCAGVPEGLSATNRTLWPLTGGSLSIDFHHPFTYVFINLGLGSNVTNFNISLNANAQVINETGNGTFCMQKFTFPAGVVVKEGQMASLQVSTVGPTGAALYNCADIQFSANASLLPASQCTNTSGVSWTYLNAQVNSSTSTSTMSMNSTSTGAAGSNSTAKSAAARAVVGHGMGWSSALLAGLVIGAFTFGL